MLRGLSNFLNWNYARKRRLNKNLAKFVNLMGVPSVSGFVMPAGGKLRFVSRAGSIKGTTAVVLTGPTVKTIRTPLLVAGQSVIVEWVERATVVTPASGFDVQVDAGLGRWVTIAEIA